MSWRTVVVSKRAKLETKLGYLVCRGEEIKKIHLSEISNLIIESTAVSLTTALLLELINNKVNVIFCDDKHNPYSFLNAIYGSHNCSGQVMKQLEWNENTKDNVWTEIIRYKIFQQYLFLNELQLEKSKLLYNYLQEIEKADKTNREGLAAKVYFNALFGLGFKRGDDTFINAALNYGYSLILSAFNREIISQGYLTQLGIAHKSQFNYYNLSYDLMEPFRIIVDRFVFSNDSELLTSDYKHSLINMLNQTVLIKKKKHSLADAIAIYCKGVFAALENNDIKELMFYEL